MLVPDPARPALITPAIAAAITLVTLVGVALSVANPLLAIEMERWGVSPTIAGLSGAMSGVGTIMAVPFVPRLAARIGLRKVLGGAIMLSVAVFVSFWLWQSVPVWFFLRFLLGITIGALFLLSEFWINAAAPPARRGQVMGIYATALYAGFALGPAILTLVGTTGPLPYLLTAAVIGLGFVPLLLAGLVTPALHGPQKARLLSFVLVAPSATLAALVFGAIETGMVMLVPVHGLRLGMSEADATLLLTGLTLGNVLLQYPLGLLSDRHDRRQLLFAVAFIAAILAILMMFTGPSFWANWLMLFLIGGFSGALYTVGLAHLGSRFTGYDLAAANAAFVMLYSVGMLVGPPAVGLGIDLAAGKGLPLVIALFLCAYAGVVLTRMRLVSPTRRGEDEPK